MNDPYDINNYINEYDDGKKDYTLLYEIIGFDATSNNLEEKIIEQLQNHQFERSVSGRRMFRFFQEVYEYFYDVTNDDSDENNDFLPLERLERTNYDKGELEELENEEELLREETPRDALGNDLIFNSDVLNRDKYSLKEIYRILDVQLDANGDPMNDNELEGKIIQELYRWKDVNTEGGKKMFDFYQNIYQRLYYEEVTSDIPKNTIDSAWNTEDNSDYRYKTYNKEEKKWEDDEEKKEEEEMFENQKEVTTEVKDVDDNVGFVRELEYTKGVVNPILKDTYRRIVSIDSRYRDKDDYVVSTDFTVNFSETLRNVVSMKLYAVQIPITWYTISAGYGSNFFTIKPNDENSGLKDIKVEIAPGNYTALSLQTAVDNSLRTLKDDYKDISFGNTRMDYSTEDAHTTMNIDIMTVYNESEYTFTFTDVLRDVLGIHKNVLDVTEYYSYFEMTIDKMDTTSITIQPITFERRIGTEIIDTFVIDNISASSFQNAIDQLNNKIKVEISYFTDTSDISYVLTNSDSGVEQYRTQWNLKRDREKVPIQMNEKIDITYTSTNNTDLMGGSSIFGLLATDIGGSTVKDELHVYRGFYDVCGNDNITLEDEKITINSRYNNLTYNVELAGTYTNINEICNEINNKIDSIPEISDTTFSLFSSNDISRVSMDFNITDVYNTEDYSLEFYNTEDYKKCSTGVQSYRNSTVDTTLGYILGYRLIKYDFRNDAENGNYINPDTGFATSAIYTKTVTGDKIEASIRGETTLNIYLYNYFMIILDDFNQNHLNDGLVTISKKDTSVTLPTYANRRTVRRCDPRTGEWVNREIEVGSNWTQKQIYSVEQIMAEQNKDKDAFSRGAAVKDMFALLPIKASNATPGTIYVEFGGTLQQQERIYFGPVNIGRIAIKLVNDKGDVVDLNGADWSFQLVCEQLYNGGS